MRISSRRKAIAFFITLGACLVAIAVALNVSWIILNWRKAAPLIFGVILFIAIIAGLVLNTIFLVREIRRNEQHESFINAVTHELKTPITSIRLYLQTLQSRQVEEAQTREFYRVMLADSDRLMSTVEQVLRAAQLGQRAAAEKRSEVDLAAIVRDCIALAQERYNLAPGSLQYAIEGAGKEVTVRADPEELHTAVSNVLDNAVKYSDGKVEVAIRVFNPDTNHVAIRVKDRGVGIPRAELKRVFKRFYRVPNKLAAQVKGSGLGLFIVKAIALKYGGKVFAESDGEGRGTVITLEFPRTTNT